jgi:Domain of unknown function (DUF3291)
LPRNKGHQAAGGDVVQEKARIAFYTLGVLKEPVGHAVVQGFVDRIGDVYAAAEGSSGFFERSVRDVQTWEHSWGPIIVPKCIPGDLPATKLAMTLSLWRDLESVAAFAYRGVHREALSHRAEWFNVGRWPTYAAWWVPADHRPNWAEAAIRVDHLHQQGPGPTAFTFRQPYDSAGAPVPMKARVQHDERREGRA